MFCTSAQFQALDVGVPKMRQRIDVSRFRCDLPWLYETHSTVYLITNDHVRTIVVELNWISRNKKNNPPLVTQPNALKGLVEQINADSSPPFA